MFCRPLFIRWKSLLLVQIFMVYVNRCRFMNGINQCGVALQTDSTEWICCLDGESGLISEEK